MGKTHPRQEENMAIKLDESKILGCPYQLKATELVKEMDFLQKYQEKGIKKENHEEIFNEQRGV